MARVKQTFIQGHLVNKLLEAVSALNYVRGSLEPSEEKLIVELKEITDRIISIDI